MTAVRPRRRTRLTRLIDAVASGVRHLPDLALVGLIVVASSGVVLARVVPMTGRATFVVASGSMAPAIPVGAAVIVEPVDPAALREGDVVSLRSGPQRAVFTHRITRVVDRADGRWIETRGDANADRRSIDHPGQHRSSGGSS